MSDDWYSGDDNGSSTGWSPSCDICFLLYSIKSTVEGNQSRLQQIQSYLNTLAPMFTANFDTNFPWDYQVKEKCEDENLKSYQGTGKGIPALVAMHRDLALMLKDIQKASCENDNFAVVPEWWQLRPEADRPQLIVQCAEKNADGSLGSAKYVVTIPHYRYTSPTFFAPFSRLEKGSYQGVLTLKDNSKVIIYGKSIAHTRSVLLQIYSEIDSNYKLPFNPQVGPIGNPDFKEITVYPKYGKYFPTGARKTVPQWVVRYG
jgi:hypothetical protein